jgi:hypothetical protein
MKSILAIVVSILMMLALSNRRSNATTSDLWSDWLGLSLALIGSALGAGLVFFIATKFGRTKLGFAKKYALLVSLMFTIANGIYWTTGSYAVFLIEHDETRRWSGFLAILAFLAAFKRAIAAVIVAFCTLDLVAKKIPHLRAES